MYIYYTYNVYIYYKQKEQELETGLLQRMLIHAEDEGIKGSDMAAKLANQAAIPAALLETSTTFSTRNSNLRTRAQQAMWCNRLMTLRQEENQV